MRLIVAGSRGITDRARIEREIRMWKERWAPDKEMTVITGGARGVDTIAHEIAKEAGHPTIVMKADWHNLGMSAGYKRNERMARKADALLAIWDGESRGTMHMIKIAREQGLTIRVVKESEFMRHQEETG